MAFGRRLVPHALSLTLGEGATVFQNPISTKITALSGVPSVKRRLEGLIRWRRAVEITPDEEAVPVGQMGGQGR